MWLISCGVALIPFSCSRLAVTRKKIPSLKSVEITPSGDRGDSSLRIARDSPSFMDTEREPVKAIAADANRPKKEHEAAGASVW